MAERALQILVRKVCGSNPGIGPLENSMLSGSLNASFPHMAINNHGIIVTTMDEWDHCNNMEHTHTVNGTPHTAVYDRGYKPPAMGEAVTLH